MSRAAFEASIGAQVDTLGHLVRKASAVLQALIASDPDTLTRDQLGYLAIVAQEYLAETLDILDPGRHSDAQPT